MRRCVVLLACAALAAAQSDENVRDTPASRAQAMLAKMNLTEKIDLVHGWNGAYVVRARFRGSSPVFCPPRE
jgi:hypothetical protein